MSSSTDLSLDRNAVLLLIDLQRAVDDPSWGPRNNAHAEFNVARLLSAWRKAGAPVIHARHDSVEPRSTYRPGQRGNEFKPEAMPAPGEPVVAKHTNSAFIGTDLERRLRSAGRSTVVVVGVSSSNSVDATVRMSGNLGFRTFMVEDATFTFDKRDWNGTVRSAQDVHALALATLHGEYCTVVTTEQVLAALPVQTLE
jgi:nicotinamidase-related amidase